MTTHKNLMTVCVAALFTLGLAACGGGGGGDDGPTTTTPPMPEGSPLAFSDLEGGLEVTAGQYHLTGAPAEFVEALGGVEQPQDGYAPGAKVPVGGLVLECAAGAGNCSIAVNDDGSFTVAGTILVVAEGGTPPVATLPPEPVLTELQQVQADAMTAATAAATAAGDARTAADEAKAAIADLATWQTVDEDGAYYSAHAAEDYAGKAQTAADDAMTAADAAADATDVPSAARALVDAENARNDAMGYRDGATTKRSATMAAAENELMIDGTVKSVGDVSLDATAGTRVETTGEGDDAQTVRTGLLADGMQPMTTGTGVTADDAATGVQDNPATTDDDETVKHKQAVADRTFPIGKVVDDRDDVARLMIVTQYAGSKNAYVFAYDEANPLVTSTADGRTGTEKGKVTLDDNDADTTDTNNTSLKSVGTFYLAGTDTDTDGLAHNDVVADDAEPIAVYSFVDHQETDATDDDVTVYVVLDSDRTEGDTTTYVYRSVDVEVEVALAGDEAAFDTKVRAAIPEATDYKHIHFGVWAALGDAKKDGTQAISDLGIGFLQNFSGSGLTPVGGGRDDMPNNGDAMYSGNWVATVRAADEDGDGDISLEHGDATLMADFSDGEITATLMGLATLEGEISGNVFSGDEAEVMDGNPHGLDTEGKFTGYVAGGFYGDAAAEAGGVFDFTSEDQEAGEFQGAFGGDKR